VSKTESVWDYPRPPRIERTTRRIRIDLGGEWIVDTTRAMRVLETSHPPVYYVPIDDVKAGVLRATTKASWCEYKGTASYFDVGDQSNCAWTYAGHAQLKNHVAFYPSRMTACWVDDERAKPQAGDFYGGWITSDILGPFKGEPGTQGW